MKVSLINPARHITDKSIWKRIDRSLPSLGIAYIASYLRDNGVDVNIIDMKPENLAVQDVINRLKQFDPDFIGFTASTVQINPALSIAEIVKKRFPDKKIIFGGVHPTVFPEEILQNEFVDFVVRTEGEITMSELIAGKKTDEILGLSYKDKSGQKILHNKDRPFIENLDELPMPAFDLLPITKYRPSLGNYKRLPAMSLITSRGCPGKCSFCYTKPMGRKIRFRSAQKIVEEIEFLIDNYGIKEISFYDDTFTLSKKNVKDFCNIIIEKKIDVTWSCMSRVDFIDEEMLGLMKKAGCHQIGYGIESASEDILKNINKNTSLEKARTARRLTSKAGIDCRAMFMLGSPGETKESIEKTIRFALDLNPDMVIFNITTPLPGTEMFFWAKEKGYLKSIGWDDYDLSHHIMDLPTIDSKTIMSYYKEAYKKFYLRPTYLLQRLLKIRSFSELKINIKTFSSLLGFYNA